MENNPQSEKSVIPAAKTGAANKYANMVALFAAGTVTTYLALKSGGYSFLKYLVIFGGIYSLIVGAHWLVAAVKARK